MKKSSGNIRLELKFKQEIEFDIYSDEGETSKAPYEPSPEEKQFFEQILKNPPKFRKGNLLQILGEKEIIWKCVQTLAKDHPPISKVYTSSTLKNYLGKPLSLLSFPNPNKTLCIEDILAMQYCLAFYSDYKDAYQTPKRRGRYVILVNELQLENIYPFYAYFPQKRAGLYEKTKKEILHKIPRIVKKHLGRNTAANEFAELYDLLNAT